MNLSIRRSLLAAVVAAVALAASSCGESFDSQRKQAQSTADKYFEYVKNADYEGAYKNTLSKTYRSRLSIDKFVLYRGRLAATTGPLVNAQVTNIQGMPKQGVIRMTYSLEAGDPTKPFTEILDLVPEDGDWKINELDVKGPTAGAAAPAAGASGTVPRTPAGSGARQ